jgi:hypothetical protein
VFLIFHICGYGQEPTRNVGIIKCSTWAGCSRVPFSRVVFRRVATVGQAFTRVFIRSVFSTVSLIGALAGWLLAGNLKHGLWYGGFFRVNFGEL